MKKYYLMVAFLSLIFSTIALAQKPEQGVRGKSTAEQKQANKETMLVGRSDDDEDRDDWEKKRKKEMDTRYSRDDRDDEDEDNGDYDDEDRGDKKDKRMKQKEMDEGAVEKTNHGLAQQREKKSEQIQKELDKGSEQGQVARKTRKKWWKFRE